MKAGAAAHPLRDERDAPAPGLTSTSSRRVVGDVIGKYHPHGDSSIATTRWCGGQDFSLRFTRWWTARATSAPGTATRPPRCVTPNAASTPIAELLLSEIDRGTVDFPPQLRRRLRRAPAAAGPALPLRAAQRRLGHRGRAWPPRRSRPTTCAKWPPWHPAIENRPPASPSCSKAYIKGPDYPGGGPAHLARRPTSARPTKPAAGSLELQARWVIAGLARGQWQLVVTGAAAGASQPEGAVRDRDPSPTPAQDRQNPSTPTRPSSMLMLAPTGCATSRVRTRCVPGLGAQESQPGHGRVRQPAASTTSLETSASTNLVMIGLCRPGQKNPPTSCMVGAARIGTVRRRTAHRLGQVNDRIHILEGRHIVFPNIDEVIPPHPRVGRARRLR